MIVVKKSFYDEYCMQKGIKDRSKLVRKQITNKNGKRTTVWVRPDELPKSKSKGSAEEATEMKNDAGTRTTGDTILYVDDRGKQHNGLVTAVGKTGVTVTDEKGNEGIHIPHENVKKVLAKVNDKDTIRSLYDARKLVPTFRGSDGLQPESCDSLEGLWKAATEAMPDFSKYSETVKQKFASLNPILLKRQTLKGQERAKEKLMADEKEANQKAQLFNTIVDTTGEKPVYHCRTLRDVDGHTFCCRNIEDVSKLLDYFISDEKNIIRIKNNFANPSAVGYSDINMNIKLPNGTIAEIQLNTTANMVAKERYGHSLYEVYRSISSNPEYKQLADLMGSAQKKLYGLSNKYSKDGTFPSEITNPFGATFKPYAEAIRQDLRKALPLIKIAYNKGAIDSKTYGHVEDLLKRIN